MATLVDQPPSPHLADLVNSVGELVAAVLDMDDGVTVRHVTAIDVGDARHVGGLVPAGSVDQSMPSALSFRCRAERSMPTNSAVREILPPKRLICARR